VTQTTVFQLYHGSQFYRWRKPEDPKNTTDLPQVIDRLHSIKLCWALFTTCGNRTHNTYPM